MWLRTQDFAGDQELYLSALGRALALAQNLEHNARFVLTIADMTKGFAEGRFETLDATRDLVEFIQHKMLGGLVCGFERHVQVSEAHLALLQQGKDARNYMAHEAAAGLPYLPRYDHAAGSSLDAFAAGAVVKPPAREPRRAVVSEGDFRDRVERFHSEVVHLARADNLVSCWSLEIQEKDAPPRELRTSYVGKVITWILEPLGLFPAAADEYPALRKVYPGPWGAAGG